MNIFLIPSWYPTQESPNTGRFFKDQAFLYANEYQEDNIIISRWGQGEFIVNLFSPLKALKKLFAYAKAHPFKHQISANVSEFYSPAVEIRPRKYAGDIAQIAQANVQNFEKAQQQYGKIDIIHAQVSFPAGFIAEKLSKKFGIPYVITEHMGPFPFPFYAEGNKLNRRLQEAFREADRVIAVSGFLKEEMFKYGIAVDEIIPDFIDDDFFSPGIRTVSDEFVLFSLGRITKAKGIDTLIKAFASALQDQPDMVLKIGGIAADMHIMIELAKNLGIDSKIEWLGELDMADVRANLRQCDAFVCASTYETFGVSVSEALCCGRAVVSTRCGGPEDMVDDQNGILVPIGDVSAMADAIRRIHKDNQKFDPTEIRMQHLKKFGQKAVTARVRGLYVTLAENK